MNTIEFIKSKFQAERVESIDKDYLEYELNFAKKIDLEKIENLLNSNCKISNPHNSILLYVTGLTDEFDFIKARVDTAEGTPADIDVDFAPSGRMHVRNYILQTYGKDYVAQIGAIGTHGMKSSVHDFFRIKEPVKPLKKNYEDEKDFKAASDKYDKLVAKLKEEKNKLLKLIPPPKAGLQPDLEKTLKYSPHLANDYPEFYNYAKLVNDQRKQLGVHAAGILISPQKITDFMPLFKNSKYEAITQFDKVEVEKLGFIKFDLLVIDALDTIKYCIGLVNKNKENKLSLSYIYNHHEPKVYRMLHEGMVTGTFQMETSAMAAHLIKKIKPMSIDDLGDINALNRPGCLEAPRDEDGNIIGPPIVETYLENVSRNEPPDDMPIILANILKSSKYCMIYQEQIMQVFSEMAGFSLREADDARRAMGKKDEKLLNSLRDTFVQGCVAHNSCTKEYAEYLFSQIKNFASYGFNRSHSVAYSYITYATAWLKYHYPIEFFTAMLTVKSSNIEDEEDIEEDTGNTQKAKEKFTVALIDILSEVDYFGIDIRPPSINKSENTFVYSNNHILYGLSGIKGCGEKAIEHILEVRENGPFIDVFDFLSRVHKNKINIGKFKVLVQAGCFDCLGYNRTELISKAQELYDFYSDTRAYKEQEEKIIVRNREIEEALKAGTKKPTVLKSKPIPIKPDIEQHKKIFISYEEIIEQREVLGAFIGNHPTKCLQHLSHKKYQYLLNGDTEDILFYITKIKEIITKKGDLMAFITIEDYNGSIADATLFPKQYMKYQSKLKVGAMGNMNIKVQNETPLSVIVNSINFYEV